MSPRPFAALLPSARRFPLASLPLAVLLPLVGCAPAVTSRAPAPVVRVADRDVFFDDAMTVLRERDLQPRYLDRVAGRLETRPTTSKQWFEFWRSDSPGAYQTLESSLHTIRRTVFVELTPATDGAPEQYTLDVRVEKQRLASPQRQATTPSGALSIYSERLPTEEGLRRSRSADDQWVPLGRDALMEQSLTQQLESLTQ